MACKPGISSLGFLQPQPILNGRAILILAGLSSLVAVVLYWQSAIAYTDDAYIYLTVARNIADGAGPVLNPGDSHSPVTSLLWAYLLAAAHSILPLMSLPLVAKILSAGLLFSASYLLAVTLGRQLGLVGLAVPFALSSVELFAWTVGLETLLAVAMLALVLGLAWAGRWTAAAATLGIGFFARGDLILLAAPLAVLWILEDRPRPRKIAVKALALFTPILLGMLFQAVLTGEPLPSTLRAKSLQGQLGPWKQYSEMLLIYLWAGVGRTWPGLFFSVIGAVVARRFAVALISFSVIHSIAYAILRVANYQWYSWGLQLTCRVLMVIGVATVVAAGVRCLTQYISLPKKDLTSAALGLIVAALLTMTVLSTRLSRQVPEGEPGIPASPVVAAYRDIAELLCTDPEVQEGRTVLMEEVGAFSYFCPSAVIRDVNGLASPQISQSTMNNWLYWVNKYSPKYILKRERTTSKRKVLRVKDSNGRVIYRYHKVNFFNAGRFAVGVYHEPEEPQ